MAQPLQPAGLQVDANRVITVLKNRLLDEISKNAVLEAALLDAQDRERMLAAALQEAREAQLQQEQGQPAS